MTAPNVRSIIATSLVLGLFLGTLLRAEEPTPKPAEEKVAARPIVVLAENTTSGDVKTQIRWGLTAVEIYRQAFLLTAREDFGLRTRDPLLGEEASGPEVHRFVMEFSIDDQTIAARLSKAGDDGKADARFPPIDLKFPNQPMLDYSQLSPRALQLAPKEFADALKQAGLTRVKGLPPAGETEVPPQVEAALSQMSFPLQFAAVRQLHAIMRTKGPSPALLGTLVRGYAHLGVLSEVYFNSAHRAYKARSLLYADRLMELRPGSAMARRHRAYAHALFGRPGHALLELKIAQGFNYEETKKGLVTPTSQLGLDWSPILDEYCSFRTDLLAKRAGTAGSQKQLILLLAMLAQEYAGTEQQKLEAAHALLKASPESYRAVATMCVYGGVSEGHRATMWGDHILRRSFARRVAQMPGLPADVAKLVKGKPSSVLGALFGLGDAEPEDEDEELAVEKRVALRRALQEAGRGDEGELTWGALARLLREELYLEAFYRADFLRHKLSVPADDYVQSVRPLIADHPLVGVVDSFREPPDGSPEAMKAALEGITMACPEPAAAPALLHLYNYGDREAGQTLWWQMYINGDLVIRDVAMRLRNENGAGVKYWGAVLGRISSLDPLATSIRIREEWKQVESIAGGWENNTFAHSALVLSALGRKHYELGNWEPAQRCLQKAIAISPERWVYELLAESFLKQGDEARWQATLDDYLSKTEDYGLDHAGVQVRIADHFMDKREFPKALPYALAAAETWASWGMMCASNCYTGLEDWENAELWIERMAERYPNLGTSLEWYAWCRMTGHGDLAAAQTSFEDLLANLGHTPTFDEMDRLLLFNMLDNQPKSALDVTQEMCKMSTTVHLCMFGAILADELGNTVQRDGWLAATDNFKEAEPDFAKIAADLLALLKDKDKKFEPDPKMLAEVKSNDVRSQLAFVIGYLLQSRKQNDLAKKFYQLSVDQNMNNRWSHKIAVTRLREMASE